MQQQQQTHELDPGLGVERGEKRMRLLGREGYDGLKLEGLQERDL